LFSWLILLGFLHFVYRDYDLTVGYYIAVICRGIYLLLQIT